MVYQESATLYNSTTCVYILKIYIPHMWELLILFHFFPTREHKSKCAAVGMQSWFEQNHLLSNCN